MKKIQLPQEYAVVLRIIKLHGRENLTSLSETLRFDRAKLLHIIENLQHKGLILAGQSISNDAWIRLTHKGDRLLRGLRLDLSAAAPA